MLVFDTSYAMTATEERVKILKYFIVYMERGKGEILWKVK
jgi:hypothetical protein